MKVEKLAAPDGSTKFMLETSCANILGCVPDLDYLTVSFVAHVSGRSSLVVAMPPPWSVRKARPAGQSARHPSVIRGAVVLPRPSPSDSLEMRGRVSAYAAPPIRRSCPDRGRRPASCRASAWLTISPPTMAMPSGRRTSPPSPNRGERQSAEDCRHRGHHDGAKTEQQAS